MKTDAFQIQMRSSQCCDVKQVQEKDGISIFRFSLTWTKEDAEQDAPFTIAWCVPMAGILYRWNTDAGFDRSVPPNWYRARNHKCSMLARQAPVVCFYDGNDENKFTFSISECKKFVEFEGGVEEESGNVICNIRVAPRQFTNQFETSFLLRIDQTKRFMGDVIEDCASWWSNDLGLTPSTLPLDATEPVYSFWYSFHQNVTAENVEQECARARELGFRVCIVDDGWQTDDNNRGYAYCGDWIPAPNKFPDMAAHIKNVHTIGMKYVLWYSVPFMGYRAKRFSEFENMLLRRIDRLSAGVLDPRYKKVREFLIETYKHALVSWDLDGFKLDFIDQWFESEENAPYHPDMDICALQDAVDVLMTDITKTLKAIKPDILLEFRQGYIGPHMKTYGNMFRVADCPGDYLSNRIGIFDLRMFLSPLAVHADMLIWHKDEKPQIAALQIISVMFGVLQYSAPLAEQTAAMKKMSKFYLDFLRAHRICLLSGKLTAHAPHLFYPWATAVKDGESITAVYAADQCIKPEAAETMYLVNGSMGARIVADLTGTYSVLVLDCFGEQVSAQNVEFRGISAIDVPVGGMAILKMEEK